jgi:putative RNA 2'-phosphotransferase
MKTTEASKFLSYILRHKPESIGLSLNEQGWLNLDDLIQAANEHGQPISKELIASVVSSSDKKRFSISDNGLMIRAAQGHSTTQVNLSFKEVCPPEFLYHGTATRFLKNILEQGLKPMSRQYVHLSEKVPTAIEVGKRYGDVVLLKINALEMYSADFKFYQSENNVWLVESVPPVYFSQCDPTA